VIAKVTESNDQSKENEPAEVSKTNDEVGMKRNWCTLEVFSKRLKIGCNI